MRRPVLLLPAVVLLLGAGEPGGDAKKIEGTWSVVRHHNNGSESKKIVGETVVIKDNKLIVQGKGEHIAGGATFSFTLDSTKKPPEINVRLNPRGKSKEGLGIYELKGDTLRIALHFRGERAKEFPNEPKPGYALT